MSRPSSVFRTFTGLVSTTLLSSLFCLNLAAQTTISTGSIQGTITDQGGAVVSGAKVTITNQATGQSVSVNTSERAPTPLAR